MDKRNVRYQEHYWMFAKLDALPPRAKQLIFEYIYSGLDGFCETRGLPINASGVLWYLSNINFDECESESEKIFCVAFELFNFTTHPDNYDACYKLHKQYRIGKYRADFAIVANENYGFQGSNYKVVIECDGHEYHNKTADQVLRDRDRDVEMRFKGYEIFHFSGTQIFDTPTRCAANVFYALQQEQIQLEEIEEKMNGK